MSKVITPEVEPSEFRKNFVFPKLSYEDFRKKYVAEVKENNTGWTTTHVRVLEKNEDGKIVRVIYEYDRNYSMMKTFHPFRQYDETEHCWHDYAFISPDYEMFQVLNLETGEIQAKEPIRAYNTESKQLEELSADDDIDWNNGKYFALGFCPVEFRVFDIDDEGYDLELLQMTLPEHDFNGKHYPAEFQLSDNNLRKYCGTWALVSGCVWGDDSSWKIRYVDLSQLLSGKVNVSDKFGYLELSDTDTLADVEFVDGQCLVVPVKTYFNLNDGSAPEPDYKFRKQNM